MNAINTEETKKLPQLVKGSSIYKLVVPENVEEKIRYLLRKFPSTEWSGVLFVTHEGSFENNDLVITCEDIYPMDLGNATFTEFTMNEDVAAYMAENIELFDCDTAILHSHHCMTSTPSGTDLNTLKEEGNERNCFVSLIVNNAGKYYAAITRKVQTKSEVTVKKLGTSYEFFGEGAKEVEHDNTETTKVIEKEVIEYFDLEVERHVVPNTLAYLDDRFDEIAKKKATERKNNWDSSNIAPTGTFFDWMHSKPVPKEQELFGDTSYREVLEKPYKDDHMFNPSITDDWQPDPKKIHAAVVHMITCNLIINPEKFDLKQWVTKHMKNVYIRIFGESSIYECEHNTCGAFSEWRDFIIQHTLDYFDTTDVPDSMWDDVNLFQSRIAQAMRDEIMEFIDVNPYIEAYNEALVLNIVE
uniref:Ubiquitin-like protein n=1 Tax=CrAss-like virus sp. ctjK323 TaxID=2825839 RepID=A0A8S5Q0U4_9CAUD|nr:MAG TPA: Ubiquitin-like protein [CrAss-like virus sp. ctjK323]